MFGPGVLNQRVNLCCVSLIWMVMQREYTGFILVRAKEGPMSSGGGVLYFLAPKCLRWGYKM
jgi:hypothetical protein